MSAKYNRSRVGILVFGLLVFLQACGTSRPMVRSEFDKGVDFSRYQSFGFFKDLATDDGYESLTTKYLKAAVIRQMVGLGYSYMQADADLLVNFKIKLKDKQVVRTSGYPGGYYGYRGGYYGAWGGYNDTYTYDYTEGTLNIDVVDRVRKQMIWEGIAVGRVNQKDLDNQEQKIGNAVAQIYEQFPLRNIPK